MNREELESYLKAKACKIRADIIEMTCLAASGHPGGSLSAADVLAVLYFHHMRHDPKNPKWEGRDRFVLSKGHACPVLYAALAEAGYFDREHLKTLRKLGSILQGHPDMRKAPGVEISSGSLGQGLAVACGMAKAAKIKEESHRVFVMIGDGESQEGEIWESAMFAAHYELDNLVAITDYNNLQIDGFVSEVMEVQPLAEKWRAFSWHVIEIDGHDIGQIIDALEAADQVKGKPTMIVANTTKGKGVSFMEGVCDYHGKAPTKDEMERALSELK